MGGVAIIIAIWVGYLRLARAHRRADHARRRCWCCSSPRRWGSSASSTTSSRCAAQRNLGLNKTSKLVGQLLTGADLRRSSRCASPTPTGSRPASTTCRSSATSPCSRSALVGFVVFAYLIVAAWSNAVNLTDGLDGLAAGTAGDGAGHLRDHRVLAVPQRLRAASAPPAATRCATRSTSRCVAAAAMGGCIGFLWWNAAPGPDLHGRHGLAGARRADRRACRS